MTGGTKVSAGAFVVSLDFELHWGVRDKYPAASDYHRNLLGAREAIPQMLDLFEEFDIAATWATVGFLFADSRCDIEGFSPTVRPMYSNPALSPYQEPIGHGEEDDPLHFAPGLIDTIRRTPRQEIASHTFSHYYCLEPGQGRAEFEADLTSAIAIAAMHGIQLRSMVFPRNQLNPDYADILVSAGISCYRGNQPGWMYQAATSEADKNRRKRIARFLDAYLNVSGSNVTPWKQVLQPNGLCNVPASYFLRPYSPLLSPLDFLRLRRVVHGIRAAAISKGIFHLWWHPHNFGSHTGRNMAFLTAILKAFAHCREAHGMRSMTMAEVAEAVTG